MTADTLSLTDAAALFNLVPGAVGALWGWIVATQKDIRGWWRLGVAAAYGAGIIVMFGVGLVFALRISR